MAALDLIAESGLEEATVQRILERSGAGAGTFYARFDGRDALLTYLATRFWSDAEEGWDKVLAPDRWSAASAEEVIVQFTRTLVLWTRAHGALLRAFLVHAMTQADLSPLERTVELDNTVADRLSDLLLMRGDDLTHPDPERAIRLATLQVFATLRSRVIFAWGDREDGIEDEDLASELAAAFMGYLGTPRASPATDFGARPRGTHREDDG